MNEVQRMKMYFANEAIPMIRGFLLAIDPVEDFHVSATFRHDHLIAIDVRTDTECSAGWLDMTLPPVQQQVRTAYEERTVGIDGVSQEDVDVTFSFSTQTR